MDNLETQTTNLEIKSPQDVRTVDDESLDSEKINTEINNIYKEVEKQQETIINTIQGINEIRNSLQLIGKETDIPSIEFEKRNINQLENKKLELEKKLSEILKSDVSEKYKEIIDKAKQSKIDWANSKELARRLRLKGAEEEDIVDVKNWLINNTNGAKVFILPPDKYKEIIKVIKDMTGEDSLGSSNGFYTQGNTENVPDFVKNSVIMKEKTFNSNSLDQNKTGGSINEKTLHHELGHATQDGLLEAEQFKNSWNPIFKDGAPDKKYVGQIQETDTKIRSMFRTLEGSFDPEKEVFGRKHLEILIDKLSKNLLDKDTKDLLEHYNYDQLIKMANRMPAI